MKDKYPRYFTPVYPRYFTPTTGKYTEGRFFDNLIYRAESPYKLFIFITEVWVKVNNPKGFFKHLGDKEAFKEISAAEVALLL